MQHIVQASRAELDLTLLFVDGYGRENLPNDLFGHIFINSSVGSINSEGLPFPKFNSPEDEGNDHMNPEYGTPMLNGDSLIIRIDFDEVDKSIVKFKSRLLKTPCYYADEATGFRGSESGKWKYRKYVFQNWGFGRISKALGSRNQINTAVIPVRYPGDNATRLFATVDSGRPYEFDPVTLEIRTPIGHLADWKATMPPIIQRPFPAVFASAHPVFDPNSQEFFTVNFRKSTSTMLGALHFSDTIDRYPNYVLKELRRFAKEEQKAANYEDRVNLLEKWYATINKRIHKHKSIWEKLFDLFQNIFRWLVHTFAGIAREVEITDRVFLMKWDGNEGKMRKWLVQDEAGEDLKITQIMHQMGITKDYLILMNTSFKFTMDQAFIYPIEKDSETVYEIDRMIRDHTTVEQTPFTEAYLVKRSDLESGDTVRAKSVLLDHSTLHFNANYDNPDGEITLFCANNTANCAAEWIRPYDTLVGPDPSKDGQPIDKDWLSFFAVGNMDVCTVGKYVIKAETGEVDQSKSRFLTETGNMEDPGNIGPHTWGIALYTYRDIISAEKASSDIKQIYWQNMGLSPETLTRFVYDLYKDYSNERIVPPEEVARLSWESIPGVLIRTDTSDMQIQDYFQFPHRTFMRAIQFVNRKREGQMPENVDPSMDGYLFICMLVPVGPEKDKKFETQFWIFDAADLQQGPICKLYHPDIVYNYPLHSAWLPEIETAAGGYHVNIPSEYNKMIDERVWFPWNRAKMKRFFNKNVYPKL